MSITWILKPSIYIKLAIAGASLAIMLGFLGHIHQAFDTIAHSRLHFAGALVVAFIVMLLTQHFKSAIIALIFACVGLYFSASGLPISNLKPVIQGKPVYSMFHLNLLFNNTEQRRTIDIIKEHDPDLISFTEASILWDEMLYQLIRDWPYLYHCPEFNKRGGVKIYSKWPINKENTYCGVNGSLALIETTAPNDMKINIGSAHMRWPWPASGPKQMANAKPKLETLGRDALIAGDFNATTWSLNLKEFAEQGNLSISIGIGPSWMFRELPEWLISIIGLPIDQIMHKGRIHIIEAKTLPSVGSDHLPVLVRFQLLP